MPSTALLLSLLAGVAVGGHTPASSVHEDSPPLLVPKRFIVWFREGNMRVHDNAALNAAASYSGAKEVIPVCVLDTRQFEASEWGSPKMGSLRAKFLIETIGELRSNLKKLGSNLLVGIGSPEELIPLLVKRDASASEEVERVTGKSLPWSEIERATTLLFETQTTPAMADISQLVLDAMPNQVSWQHFWGGTLFNRESLPFKSDLSDVPDVFEDYKKAIGGISWEAQVDSMLPTPAEGSLPLPADVSIAAAVEGGLDYETLPDVSGQPPSWRRTTWRGATVYAGGESSGLKRLRGYDGECMAVKATAGEEKAKDIRLKTWAPFLTSHPEMLSTKLSPWIANGALSPKMVAKEINKEAKLGGVVENDLTYELIARDFYRLNCAKHGASLYLPDGPPSTDRSFRDMFKKTQPTSATGGDDPEILVQRWKDGETGVPLIDALMRELLTTGYISHRGRQHAASYFVHDLGLDWRIGADHFQASLLDYDVCSNWGNWAMVAGLSGGGHLSNFPTGATTDANRQVLTFDHVAQGNEFDPLATYTRYWVPELRAVPPKQVQEPWKLSAEEQKSYQVLLRPWTDEELDTTWYPFPVSRYLDARSRRLLALRVGLANRRRATHTLAHVGGGGGGATLPALGMGLSGSEPPSFGSWSPTCSVPSPETADWFEEWEDRMRLWWAATPYRSGAQACFGALGVHLMQRLESMVRLWQMAQGQPPAKPPPAAEGMRDECQTLLEHNAQKLQLPDFPEFPAEFSVPPVLPIPRLLPGTEWIQSLGPLPHEAAQAVSAQRSGLTYHELPLTESPTDETLGQSEALLFGAAGSALGFGAALGIFALYKQKARGRVMASPDTPGTVQMSL